MDWSNEKVLEFIELYQAEDSLWNSKNKFHKHRNVTADAWERIKSSITLECSVADLKKKKESLMTTYRHHLNKKKKSVKSGAGHDEIYQTTWFAYAAMDSFLGSNYDCITTRDTEVSYANQTLFNVNGWHVLLN